MGRPAFYCCKTLLGGAPDVNRRTIYADDTGVAVKVFNYNMDPWTAEMQAEVDRELESLNSLAGTARKWLRA